MSWWRGMRCKDSRNGIEGEDVDTMHGLGVLSEYDFLVGKEAAYRSYLSWGLSVLEMTNRFLGKQRWVGRFVGHFSRDYILLFFCR